MPHCVIEIANQLSSSVTPDQLLRCVFDAHVKSGLFDTDHIKVRCTGYDHHISGTGPTAGAQVSVEVRKEHGGDRSKANYCFW